MSCWRYQAEDDQREMGEEEELVDDLFHVGEEDGEAEDKVDEGRDS